MSGLQPAVPATCCGQLGWRKHRTGFSTKGRTHPGTEGLPVGVGTRGEGTAPTGPKCCSPSCRPPPKRSLGAFARLRTWAGRLQLLWLRQPLGTVTRGVARARTVLSTACRARMGDRRKEAGCWPGVGVPHSALSATSPVGQPRGGRQAHRRAWEKPPPELGALNPA